MRASARRLAGPLLALALAACGPSQAELDATATSVAQVAETATATSAFATAETLAVPFQLAFGPEDLSLEHNPNDKQVVTFEVEDERRDFVVAATFVAPYDAADNPWDAGFLIRSTGDDEQLRVIIYSDGSWYLVYADPGDPPTFETIQEGTLPSFDGGAGARVAIRVVAQGERGMLFVNDSYVAELDLSRRMSAGTIMAGTGFYTGDEQEGAVTEVEGFTIWGVGR